MSKQSKLLDVYFMLTKLRNRKEPRWQAKMIDGENISIYVPSKKSAEPESIGCNKRYVSYTYLCSVDIEPVFTDKNGRFKIFEVTILAKSQKRGEILTCTFSYHKNDRQWQSSHVSQLLSENGEMETIYVPNRSGILPAEDISSKPKWSVMILRIIFGNNNKQVITVKLIEEIVSKRALARRKRKGCGNIKHCAVA